MCPRRHVRAFSDASRDLVSQRCDGQRARPRLPARTVCIACFQGYSRVFSDVVARLLCARGAQQMPRDRERVRERDRYSVCACACAATAEMKAHATTTTDAPSQHRSGVQALDRCTRPSRFQQTPGCGRRRPRSTCRARARRPLRAASSSLRQSRHQAQ